MSNQKKRKKKNAAVKEDRYAGMSPNRRKLHQRADQISDQFAAVEKSANRILLVILVVIVFLWLFKVIPAAPTRYAIFVLLGTTLGMNGLSAYKEHRGVGFFLMVFGTVLMISCLVMLANT